MSSRLRVDPIACRGHGLCAELVPELVSLDDWGYPMLAAGPIPADLAPLARRAAKLCPTLALTLEEFRSEPPPSPVFQPPFNRQRAE